MIRLALALSLLALPAAAQERIPSHCIALAGEIPGATYLHLAAWQDPVALDEVRIAYIDHAAFLIQTAGLAAVTDYTGNLGGAALVPDVVTMNNAHITHFTHAPDPAIPHVLPGWPQQGQPREHRLDLGEMLVRNIHTDIRGEGGRVAPNGNSIFIFEAAGLCIGHLGHLHHEPDAAQYAAIGRLDVVMAAVDGGITLDTARMLNVMQRFKARVVLPMHWFGRGTLGRFLSGMREGGFEVVETGMREITLSLDKLPRTPTVMVLEPGRLD
ncbi:MBL fold metallo-hydrolase [Sinisalibacter aestuarii]|uniref:Zn-dependent hydrolase n=1 Tax=Sinisalibacter aestuarii TaxID=2949426 RepID=A0ABQ5LX18_9RHOB|nr:MBL fold metallo-hydrolase [Sinisalibacter aestuarii]GKY89521.1 Zn-dependent hydrolase [Sinisalibacter aestuarii]